MVILVDRLANKRVTHKHINFQSLFPSSYMSSHCCTKRTSTKNNNLKHHRFFQILQKQNEIKKRDGRIIRKTLRVRSRTSVLALARQERDHRTSFSHAIRTTLRWSRLVLMISGGPVTESASGTFGEETQRTKIALCLSRGGCLPEKWRSKHAGCTEAAIFAET